MRPLDRHSRALGPFVLLSCIGFGCFFRGFFPVKPLVAGYTDAQAYPPVDSDASRPPSTQEHVAPFSRLVFMLVDALRSDFVFGPDSHMDFVRSLIASGQALPYTAIAQAPTVTLPRLKALTTGSNPTFLDAILNIADEGGTSAALMNSDSWIRQLVKRENQSTQLVFAGDDTWLRLFPQEWFEWSEGVNSFFVSDTHLVDSNVTRHLDILLADSATPSPSPSSEWDALILHYLGLDHVGHLEGPKSAMMKPKQREMDQVFERLFKAMSTRDEQDGEKSLLVLIGDHGMTEGGNHGGSTESETSAALVLAAPSLRTTPSVLERGSSPYRLHEVVQQVDLVPTLSILFDLGIPKNSMGRMIGSAVKKLRSSAFTFGLSANVQQMLVVLDAAGVDGGRLICQAATRLNRTCDGSTFSRETLDAETSSLFLRLAQDELLVSFGDYRMSYLISAILALVISSIGLLRLSQHHVRKDSFSVTRLVGLAILVHLLSFFATSFIEEEHEYWFFISATACVILSLAPKTRLSFRISFVTMAATIRIMRGWSHNGQKDFPNFSNAAYLALHTSTNTFLCILTYVVVASIPFRTLISASRALSTEKLSPAQLLPKALAFAVLATLSSLQALTGLMFKLVGDNVERPDSVIRTLRSFGLDDQSTLARIGYIVAALGWVLATIVQRNVPVSARANLNTLRLSVISLLLMSLTRTTNIPLFVVFWVLQITLSQVTPQLSPLSFAFLSVAFQSCSFFALGGSNSLATVDISQAYNGLSSYSFPLVTLLTYLSNFSGPIFFALSSRILAPSPRSHTIYTTTFFASSLATLAVSAVHFRYHLFAFTVFSPAVLYKGMWWLTIQLGTNEGLSRLLLV